MPETTHARNQVNADWYDGVWMSVRAAASLTDVDEELICELISRHMIATEYRGKRLRVSVSDLVEVVNGGRIVP